MGCQRPDLRPRLTGLKDTGVSGTAGEERGVRREPGAGRQTTHRALQGVRRTWGFVIPGQGSH